ncbi:MAG: hypothetical protein AB7L13_18415 [Acidimicrobiia bacterium]
MLAKARWIHSPSHDIALALAWLPFAVAAHAVQTNRHALETLVSATFALSFAHQPLTLGLVYGDKRHLTARPRIYSITPFVAVALIVAGLSISLSLVAILAGLWNAEHTLMQRFGLTRIYGRKAGDDHGSIEKPMLVSWLVLAVIWTGASSRTPSLIDRVPLGSTNRPAVDLLTDLQPYARVALVPAAIAAVWLAIKWIKAEVALGDQANFAKHFYVATTAMLFVMIVVDPIAGFVGYVGAHAVEYFVIVNRSLANRHDDEAIARVTSTATKRRAIYLAYFAAVATFVAVGRGHMEIYRFAILLLGALHIFYDGFIWKLRRPAIASTLGVPTASTAGPVGAAPAVG